MILIAPAIYFAVASLFVASITFAAARPMPKPGDVNNQKDELL
jgi:hypothetical protein